jgi:ABC-2 type transport system ATP-binding protein
VSLSVPKGAVFGLLGPNGAGKTSLIRIINQITGPDKGSVFLNDQPLNPSHIYNIGYLPEERGLYKKMEVGEQAIYLAQLKGLSRAEAVKRLKYWFEKFEIKGWWRKKVEELSKGMQQKVQFIVTIIHEPSLLILDEPFSGFDPINANLIKDELLSLNKNGTTIILSTHRMESVEELCSDIALINLSRKILSGSIREVRRSFSTNEFEVIHDGELSNTSSLYSIKSTATYHDATKSVISLSGSTSNDVLRSILTNTTIHSFRELIPSMNDIFIQSVTKAGSHE